MGGASGPTPYTEVNDALRLLLTEVQRLLGVRFAGLYLYGSLASGDFDPPSSDIDFLVVTEGELPGEMIPALDAMHRRIAASGLPWAAKLEGSYIPRDVLRVYDPARATYPALGEEGFHIAHHGSDWIIQRHILREQGVIVAGPEPRALIDPVAPDDLRRAVRGILDEWWARQVHNPAWFREGVYQAYAVLTMCRALYTLEYGCIVSKPAAASWARRTLGGRWPALIDQALALRHGAGPDVLDDALAFIRYTLGRARLMAR